MNVFQPNSEIGWKISACGRSEARASHASGQTTTKARTERRP
jgi:hypothetical protein